MADSVFFLFLFGFFSFFLSWFSHARALRCTYTFEIRFIFVCLLFSFLLNRTRVLHLVGLCSLIPSFFVILFLFFSFLWGMMVATLVDILLCLLISCVFLMIYIHIIMIKCLNFTNYAFLGGKWGIILFSWGYLAKNAYILNIWRHYWLGDIVGTWYPLSDEHCRQPYMWKGFLTNTGGGTFQNFKCIYSNPYSVTTFLFCAIGLCMLNLGRTTKRNLFMPFLCKSLGGWQSKETVWTARKLPIGSDTSCGSVSLMSSLLKSLPNCWWRSGRGRRGYATPWH